MPTRSGPVLFLGGVFLLYCLATVSGALPFHADSQLQPMFDARPVGWLGADCSTSIAMEPSNGECQRVLWLFGDTLIGNLTDNGKQRDWKYFIHNSVSITEVCGGKPPSPSEVPFYWSKDSNNNPFALFNPPDVANGSYYWVTAGVSLSPTQLALTAYAVTNVNGFSILRTDLILVSNANEPPTSWVYTTHAVPFSSPSRYFAVSMAYAKDAENVIYIVSQHEPAASNYAAISRVHSSDLITANFSAWEHWSLLPGESTPTWSLQSNESLENVVHLFSPFVAESSLVYVASMKKWLMPLAFPLDSRHLYLRMANEPTGPWTDSMDVYDIPLPFSNTTLFDSYAAKLHPTLFTASTPLVMTYNTNTWTLDDVSKYSYIYVPRFVITLTNVQSSEPPILPSNDNGKIHQLKGSPAS